MGPFLRSFGLTGDPSRTAVPDGMTVFRHGHPRRDTVERFLRRMTRQRAAPKQELVADGMHDFGTITMPAEIYGTGWNGAVRVVANSDGTYSVMTER
jgi:hypothetical protein